MIKRSRKKVPVIDVENGNKKIGMAAESDMIGGHMQGNHSPILKFQGKELNTSYVGDKILVWPSVSQYN